MEGKKPYLVVILVNAIYASMFLLTKAAFVRGMNAFVFVFVFYRQAYTTAFLAPAAILLERRRFSVPSCRTLLKIFMLSLAGITCSLNVYNVGLNYTTATVASAASNSIPVMTFVLAVLLGMERLDLKTLPGVGMCFGGVMLIAFYTGSSLKPHLLHLHAFTGHRAGGRRSASAMEWVKGAFLLIVANFTWSLWVVFQVKFLIEDSNFVIK